MLNQCFDHVGKKDMKIDTGIEIEIDIEIDIDSLSGYPALWTPIHGGTKITLISVGLRAGVLEIKFKLGRSLIRR